MKVAPPILTLNVLNNFEVIVKFEGLAPKKVDLKTFKLLGPKAQRLRQEIDYLRSFKIVDGIPEWENMALLGPEDLLAAANKITIEDLDRYVEMWHQEKPNVSLQDYLGLSDEEYLAFAQLTANEVEARFNQGEDLSDFFTTEVDSVTHEPKNDEKD